MRLSAILYVIALQRASAFPSALHGLLGSDANTLLPRQQPQCSNTDCQTPLAIPDSAIQVDQTAAEASRKRSNCGLGTTCTGFVNTGSDSQYVSTTGKNAYQSPSNNDIRGPCPALNAAANHGYIPRNGILTIQETVDGMRDLFGLGEDLSTLLTAYSIAYSGDPTTQTFSIGGPPPSFVNPGAGIPPEGISYSHNVFESDSSFARCDAYLNRGNAHSLSALRFAYAFDTGRGKNRYYMDNFARAYAKNTLRSVQQNPYYFASLFGSTFFVPATYNFVAAMMSNHSVTNPRGFLDGGRFKRWFGMTGMYPNFVWQPGQERIPENWYRRPVASPYELSNVINDLIAGYKAYPDTFRFGGNSNGVNTYRPISITQYAQGYATDENILEGNNFACLLYRSVRQTASQKLSDPAQTLLYNAADQAFAPFNCPDLPESGLDDSVTNQYPGKTYNPTGSAQNC